MSDRGIFVVAFLTVVMIVAGAFALPQLFFFELFKSLVYLLIAVLVFFGEDQYSYMLGMVAPPLWFIVDIVFGGFIYDFRALFDYFTGKPLPAFETPLHGLALLTEILLIILCVRAWRKEVSKPMFGKAFGICLAISLVYVGILSGWYVLGISTGGRMP